MKRILIIRLSAIGDVVMASALIPALRSKWPDAHLAWLVEPAAADLLRHNPRLNEVIVWPRNEWRKLWRARRYVALWRAVRAFRAELRARRFDLVLDIQGLFKSGVLARFTGARERVGLGSKEGSERFMTRVLERDANAPRIGSEYLFTAKSLAVDPGRFPMDLVAGEAAEQKARELLTEAGVTGSYAVIAPFTTRPQKHWFEDRWAVLAERIQGELGLDVVMLGGPGDGEAAERIAAANPRIHNLVGRTRLDETVAVIGESSLLVGVDTGLTHMGIACRRPSVALFGSTCPYTDPAFAGATVLYEPPDCAPCGRRPTCDGAFTCMRRHTVDKVFDAARRQWETAA